MKKSFAARRVPRRIAQDDDEPGSDASSATDPPSSAINRPAPKNRKSSTLRASFDPGHDDSVVTSKRSNLSRLAVHRNAEQQAPLRAGQESDQSRPTYSRDYLNELKQSTPSTPKDMSSLSTPATDTEDADLGRAVDVASKFGSDISRYQAPTAIPTDAEIKEKKERRARLAKEGDFISLEGGDDDDEDDEDDDAVTRDEEGRLILKPKEKYPETRLIHDDEDIMEGFDDFTSDGKITFGRKAEREAAKRRRVEMASLIADAEGEGTDDGDEDDESEAERNAAFEVAQTRHGTYAAREQQDADSARPQTPPRVVPLPALGTVVERLRQRLQEMEMLRANKTKEMQGLVNEKARLGEEEVRVQAALKETGEKYQKLREDMGLKAKEELQVAVIDTDRGREEQSSREEEVEEEAEDEDEDEDLDERPSFGTGGLGSGMRRDLSEWGM